MKPRPAIDAIERTRVRFVRVTNNRKTGPIPVTYSSGQTCPDACPLKRNGCYAELSKVRMHWGAGEHYGSWREFLLELGKLPRYQLWRHNVAGDLPGKGDRLDVTKLTELVRAQLSLRGFTYTHKPLSRAIERLAVKQANAMGFTINLSADSPREADELARLEIGPVVVTLPSDAPQVSKTPEGRTIVACPAETRDITCDRCELCAVAGRKAIVGFRAHGPAAKSVSRRLQVIQ